jgi:hypothetical protein
MPKGGKGALTRISGGVWALDLLVHMVAAPEDLRGTVYGFFNLRSEMTMLVTSVVAGLSEDRFCAAFTVYAVMVFCVATGPFWPCAQTRRGFDGRSTRPAGCFHAQQFDLENVKYQVKFAAF